jgi:uncharacterized protein (TIGR02996 family)
LKTVRLERGEGDARVFWEITRDGTKIRTRFGKHLAGGRTTPFKAYPTSADAEKAFAGAIAAKRKEGYAEAQARAVAGANSQKGARAFNPELEAMIAEAPDDADRYLVYADWLMQHGDPRGELIIAQHGIATSDLKDVSKFERDERALFKQYRGDFAQIGAIHMPRQLVAQGLAAIPNIFWTTAPEEDQVSLPEIDVGPSIWP